MRRLEPRQVEIMVEGVGWTPCKFSDVIAGDQFRLFEETGEVVVDDKGKMVFTAIKDAYEHKTRGVWVLETRDED